MKTVQQAKEEAKTIAKNYRLFKKNKKLEKNSNIMSLSEEDRKSIVADIVKQLQESGVTSSTVKKDEKDSTTNNNDAVDLESELLRVSRLTEKEVFKVHPWSRFLLDHAPYMTKVVKDIKIVDDLAIIQSVSSWIAASTTLTPHMKHLLLAIRKINKTGFNLSSNSNRPSILVQCINKIDVRHSLLTSSETLSDQEVEYYINDIRLSNTLNAAANNNNNASHSTQSNSSSGNYYRRGNGNVCLQFNSKTGCTYNPCKFPHKCAKHHKKGVDCEKPAFECDGQ